MLQITIPLVTLMQLFVKLHSKQPANTSQFKQFLQKCIKKNPNDFCDPVSDTNP